MLHITEDTPPDMLAGAMDLTVHLPNGRPVKMSVERSTPMMDLLVQITTNHQLQLSNYTLQALGMAPSSEYSDKILPFKPNTPIGALDTQHVRVLPKGRTLPLPKYVAPGHQPFESTFRLKVHLPRNQLYVTRVSRNVLLEDIMKKVCEEKNLDPMKYEFKHPGNLDEVLDPKLTLSDYQITEIYVVHKGTTNLSQAFSAADIMTLRKEEERKQMHNKTGGGVFNLIFKRGKSSMGSGSVSSDNRSISPTQSDDSRSVTPPGVQAPPIVVPPKKDPPPERPKPPQRKRRPAPKPPQPVQNSEVSKSDVGEKTPSVVSSDEPTVQSAAKKTISENGLTICHSRNSSDSSGYHEASILSDHCGNASLPRNRPKSAVVGVGDQQGGSNLTKMSAHSRSTTSLITGRKKKAAPPPPPVVVSPASSVVSGPPTEKPSPLVASQSHDESVTSSNFTPHDSLPPLPLESSTPIPQRHEEKSIESTDSGIAQDSHSDRDKESEEDLNLSAPPHPPVSDENCIIKSNKPEEIKTEIVEAAATPIDRPDSAVALPRVDQKEPKEATKTDLKHLEPPLVSPTPTLPVEAELGDIDWQYQLPSPPKAFRDDSPADVASYDNVSVGDFKDSVVTSPELFEKLKSLEDNHSESGTLKSEATSVASEEPLNTLSLEHLEKRKSLVYNRELATSLKMTDSLDTNTKPPATDTFSKSLINFESTYDDMTRRENKSHPHKAAVNNTLPNFKITTYDVPKQKIKVFEDDTIRSNSVASNLQKSTVIGRSMENISYTRLKPGTEEAAKENGHEYTFYRPESMIHLGSASNVSRSESFSTDGRATTKTVSRSRSHLTLNKYKDPRVNEQSIEGMSKSNSLFDVSGLQSLGVIKLIQNKLGTPTTSMENISQPDKTITEIVPRLPPKQEVKETVQETPEAQPVSKPAAVKTYHYRGPPTVELATWSERPKVPVAVKEDADYKLGNHNNNISSKLIVNTTNNNITSNNSIQIKSTGDTRLTNGHTATEAVNIKVNGNSNSICENSGNVVIKIGNASNKNFLGPAAYRRPFQNINKNATNYTPSQRPHSIALDSDFDISRVPVVRSVEFKKPYKDIHGNNTSVTHIYPGNDQYYSNNKNGYHSTENSKDSEQNKRIFRVTSYKPLESNPSPVVRGFRQQNGADISQRLSWNPTSYGTLPSKTKIEKDYSTNQNVQFSQSNLRRSESSTNNRSVNGHNSLPPNVSNTKLNVPPPPPQMPKVTLRKTAPREVQNQSPVDARDMLMESIRNFGGKKGFFKAAKA